MLTVSVHSNFKDIQLAFRNLADKEMDQAVARALNKVAVTARAEASKSLQAEGYGIKASAIKASFRIKKATRSDLEAWLRATGRPIPLINFDARQIRGGVSVKVKGKRTLLKHAFIATMPNGHTGVFERVGKAHKTRVSNGKTVRSGLPIKELFGPSIPAALSNRLVTASISSKIRTRFPEVLQQELRYAALRTGLVPR